MDTDEALAGEYVGVMLAAITITITITITIWIVLVAAGLSIGGYFALTRL
jgi:hypothetical protein